MPAASPAGLNIRKQRAGREADMLFSGENDWVLGGPNAMVFERVSIVAKTADDSFS